VLDELVAVLEPRWLEVEGLFNARGAMTTRVVVGHGEQP
jgi:NADPH-dependent 7-cyano-7-deazaguanine reductase QueF